jgi:hypothetical protein
MKNNLFKKSGSSMMDDWIPTIFKLSPARQITSGKREVTGLYQFNTSAGSLCAEGGPGTPVDYSGGAARLKRWIPFNTPKRCP